MTSIVLDASRPRPSWLAQSYQRARLAWSILVIVATASPLIAVLLLGGVAYGTALGSLPIFGDATIHAGISRSLTERAPWNVTTVYPLFYHLVGALALAADGETGFKLVTVFSLLLTIGAVYALALELTESRLCGLGAAFLATIAPKTIFYTGRMYMEVLLSALIIWAIFFFARYLRLQRRSDLIWCAIVSGLAAATKQQALLFLLPSITVFLAVQGVRHWRHGEISAGRIVMRAGLFAAVALALVVPAYEPMLHSTGAILPDTGYTHVVNVSLATVTGQHGKTDAWLTRWNDTLDASFKANDGERGFARAESRHVWPWDVPTTSRGIFGVHTLFWTNPPWRYPDWLTLPLCGLFLAGAALWIWQSRRKPILWYLALFLALNYVAFLRNNDQERYHLYLAFMLTFLIPFGIVGWREAWPRLSGAATAAGVGLLVTCAFVAVVAFPQRVRLVQGVAAQQAYAPSKGGSASVQEVGAWLGQHLDDDGQFYAVPANEFAYYAQRRGIFDYRLYFLPPDQLAAVIRDMNVRYIVIADSAIQADNQWDNVVKMPASFASNIGQLYPAVYVSSKRDIVVYDAGAAEDAVSAELSGARWVADDAPQVAAAGAETAISVSLNNDGTLVWPRSIVRLASHWNYGACPGDQADPRSVWDGTRTSLPANVAPGDKLRNLSLEAQTPGTPGVYCLVLDLVSEHVGWASRMGASPRAATVIVQ